MRWPLCFQICHLANIPSYLSTAGILFRCYLRPTLEGLKLIQGLLTLIPEHRQHDPNRQEPRVFALA